MRHTENCQIGVFLAYASKHGHALIDRELYLPESWTSDRDRCRDAGIPDDLGFATKPRQVITTLERVLAADVPFTWFTADEAYGQAGYLRDWLEDRDVFYVMATRCDQQLTTRADRTARADALVAEFTASAWQRLSVGAGAHGPREYDWARRQIEGTWTRGRGHWLLARRSIANPTEIAYYLCYGPRNARLVDLAFTAGSRWHGVTLVNFGLFDLLGMQLSPRIRDLGKITLYRPGPRTEVETRFPRAGPLLTRKLNFDLIAEHYDDLLRLAGSLKFGHATASLLVGKLSASGRQNALAAALKEYGALRRTIYAARYLSDPDYRRKISRQLNRGESIHALKRDLIYAHDGAFRARHLEAQTEQAWCLTLATNAVIAWTTEYYGLAVDQMRRTGRRIDDEVLAHISPAHSENINFFGAIEVDIDAELAALGPTGYRPLRVRDTLF